MPLDPAFVADCPYGPDALFFDEVLEIDRDGDRIVVRMPTHAELPLTRHQRVHPTRHPRHVNGGLMVHTTGTVAFAHIYFIHGLRHADGWIGYGALINKARYPNLAEIGPPIEIEARATKTRPMGEKRMVIYEFRFTQNGTVVYESNQTAMYMRVE